MMPAWNLGTDMARFRDITKGHPIIMGRKTYDSIGRRPLPGRLNIVISRHPDFTAPDCKIVTTLEAALKTARATGTDEAFVIGGGAIYAEALPLADQIYLTRVHAAPPGDTYFRFPAAGWREISHEDHPADDQNDYPYSFITLERVV